MTGTDLYNDLLNEMQRFGGLESTAEGLIYINRAILWLTRELAARRHYSHIAEETATNGADIPANFVATCGNYPMKPLAGKWMFLSGAPSSITYRYAYTQAAITALTDTIPFTDNFRNILLAAAAFFALNRDAQDIKQDTQILQMLMQVI